MQPNRWALRGWAYFLWSARCARRGIRCQLPIGSQSARGAGLIPSDEADRPSSSAVVPEDPLAARVLSPDPHTGEPWHLRHIHIRVDGCVPARNGVEGEGLGPAGTGTKGLAPEFTAACHEVWTNWYIGYLHQRGELVFRPSNPLSAHKAKAREIPEAKGRRCGKLSGPADAYLCFCLGRGILRNALHSWCVRGEWVVLYCVVWACFFRGGCAKGTLDF